jgi:hypothetical protein
MKEKQSGRIQRKTWSIGPYIGVDYNLTLCRLQQLHVHCTMGIGQPYATADLNHMPEFMSTLSPGQRLRIWPQISA